MLSNPSLLEEDIENSLRIYEDLIANLASRSRQIIRRFGPIEALSRIVVSADLQQGFRVLRDHGMLEHSLNL